MPRRERWTIIGAILLEVEREGARGELGRVTNIALRANLPYDRLVTYLGDLEAAGFVQLGRVPALTEKGRAFLREYRQWLEVLQRFGLDGVPPRPKPPAGEETGDAAGRSEPA